MTIPIQNENCEIGNMIMITDSSLSIGLVRLRYSNHLFVRKEIASESCFKNGPLNGILPSASILKEMEANRYP